MNTPLPSSSNGRTRRLFTSRIARTGLMTWLLGAMATATMVTAGQAMAADPVHIRLGAPVGAVQGIKAGIDEGYFERENIKITLVTLAGGPNILAATVGGSLEVGFADLFAWVGALENGFNLSFLQSANGRGNSDFLITAPGAGILSPKDLKGKKIGVAAHAQSKLRVLLYLQRFGLSANDVQFVVINQRDTVGAALASRQIDAAIAADPHVAQWEHQFKVKALKGRPWEQIPPTATTAGFFASPAWLEKNPGVAERFVRAARAGATRYNTYSAAKKATLALKYDKVDLFAVEREVPGTILRMDDSNAVHDGPVDLVATTQWLKVAKSHGVIKEVIDLKSRIYPTALASRL